MAKKPIILVCPLDWGIGHASRMVPLINELQEQGADVLIGAAGRSLEFLKIEFPELPFVDFPGYAVKYPISRHGMPIKIAMQFPALYKWIKREHRILETLISKYSIDGVISDNRYGLWSNQIPAIFITHQVFIQTPGYLRFLTPLIERLNKNFIAKYRECWIPDFAGKGNLSGNLSHKQALHGNYYFIGPLSRFSGLMNKNKINAESQFKYDILAILSGPEPQRSLLETKLLSEIGSSNIKAAIVLGKPGSTASLKIKENITIYEHLESGPLFSLIQNSRLIIARSGYSTLMDLAATGKRAVLIPTPGQTEQEYLAKFLLENNYFFSVSQHDFNLQQVLKKAENFSGIQIDQDKSLLRNRISNFLQFIDYNNNKHKDNPAL